VSRAPACTATLAKRRGPTLSAGLSLTGVAITFTSLYLAAGALMPLLVLYQEQWRLPAALLTLAFAVFAIGFLAAVLSLGSLSDHIGRRPVLIGALIVQLASNLMFLLAPDIGWVIVGRIVQGFASGAATTAFTAALVELAPSNRKNLGAVLGSVGLTGGLAVGSLLAGIAIQFTAVANSIIFIALTVITIPGIVVVSLSPETVPRLPGALRSMVPRIAIPSTTRREFAAAAPAIAAAWMLSGLSGGLAPSLVRTAFLLNSGLLNGLSGFISPATSSVAGVVFARVDPRRAITIGIYASVAGAVGIISGVLAGSLAVMMIGQAVIGVGFGALFTASLRLIVPLAGMHQRAAVVAAIYVVSYLAFGVPVGIAGQLADAVGLVPTVLWYSAVSILFALISFAAQRQLRRSARTVDGTAPRSELRTNSASAPERAEIPCCVTLNRS
jgi:MFS family permease